MAATRPIQLNLPADLYARIQEVAARSDQPVESVLVESLALLFGTSFVDWDHLTATLDTLPDAQLWALVYRVVAWSGSGWWKREGSGCKRDGIRRHSGPAHDATNERTMPTWRFQWPARSDPMLVRRRARRCCRRARS
jgi:hypothetical protein